MSFRQIGLIGAGQMGSAIMQAVAMNREEAALWICDKNDARAEALAKTLDSRSVTIDDLKTGSILAETDIIFIGVKPKDLPSLMADLKESQKTLSSVIWVSMIGSMSLTRLGELIDDQAAILRIMPNTPVAIGQGWISYTSNQHVDDLVEDQVVKLLAAAGHLEAVEESLFEVATAMTGCSPAFIYMMIEAMADAGVYYGLPRELAIKMAAMTVKGAGQMVVSSHQHPGQLKDAVTSPAGTTIAGVRSLEANHFRSSLIEAIAACIER